MQVLNLNSTIVTVKPKDKSKQCFKRYFRHSFSLGFLKMLRNVVNQGKV